MRRLSTIFRSTDGANQAGLQALGRLDGARAETVDGEVSAFGFLFAHHLKHATCSYEYTNSNRIFNAAHLARFRTRSRFRSNDEASEEFAFRKTTLGN